MPEPGRANLSRTSSPLCYRADRHWFAQLHHMLLLHLVSTDFHGREPLAYTNRILVTDAGSLTAIRPGFVSPVGV